MPTYNYRCKECNHEFTEIHKMSDRKIPTQSPCPECGVSDSVVQALSTFALGDPVMYGSIANRRPPMDFKEGVLDKVKKMPGAGTGGRLDKL